MRRRGLAFEACAGPWAAPTGAASVSGMASCAQAAASHTGLQPKRISGAPPVSDNEVFPVPREWAARAIMNAQAYDAAVARVEADPEGYWADVARRLDWIKFPTIIKDVS